jgi:uncharacterized protein (DUF58 family)
MANAVLWGVVILSAVRPWLSVYGLRVSQVGILESSRGVAEGASKSRTGIEVAGTHRYVAGDAYRNIHWHNSARTGRLTVKEFDYWSERSVVILVDADDISVKTDAECDSDRP